MRVDGQRLAPLGRAAFLLLLATSVAGCSTVAGFGGVPRAGYQGDGTYVLNDEQQNLGCRELLERQSGLQTQLQQLPQTAVQQMKQLPTTVANAWGRLVGSEDQGVPALAQYNEAKAESVALDQSIKDKGCNGVPVETASIPR
jgi:hypothetical protein